MTYGEAHRAELDSLQLINGEFQKTVFIEPKPKRMSREDAFRYYNNKCDKTFSLLTYKVESSDEVKDLEVGTNNLLLYRHERPDFISAPDAPAKVYQEEISRLEELIEKIAATEAISSSGNESGVTKQYRFQALNSSLIDFSTRLEDFERKCFDVACRWLGVDNKVEISYPKDYNIKDVKTEIETASALFDMNLGETYNSLKKQQLAFLDLNGLEEAQKEQIISEIEDSLKEVNDDTSQSE